jgi:hypothetical protein
MRRSDDIIPNEECIKRILDVFRDDAALRGLLLSLLPALDDRGAEETVRSDKRLCYETSLLSLLNYGIVSNAVSIKDARDALTDPKERVPGLLAFAAKNDFVRQANLRMRSVARELNLSGEKCKDLRWAIAEFFDRPISGEEMNSWTPWIDVTHVWVRGALLNYLVNPLEYEFVRDLIVKKCMHMSAQILYFHIQAHGMFGLDARRNLHPKLSAKQTHELVELAGTSFAKSILSEQSEWRLRSCVPLWIIRHASGWHWSNVQKSLSEPPGILFADGIAVLLLRTRREKSDGKALVDLLDTNAIVEAWRKHKKPDEERRKPVELAYRFLHSQKPRGL